MTPRLKETFSKEIQPALKETLGLKNIYMAPKIEKIVLNMGLGLDGADSKIFKACEEDMAKITGQKPVITKFKKSVANFKTRKGSNAGLKVTLRKNKMYEFIDRLVNIALPRIKDFRGLSSKGFDKFGNYTFGIKEHIIFPEVSFDRADKVRGETRIPEGLYKLTLRTEGGFHNRYVSKYGSWHRGMIYVNDVPNFEWILWHTGNTDESTMGCLILGSNQTENITNKDGFVGSSVVAYKKVYPSIADAIESGEEVTVNYVDYDHREGGKFLLPQTPRGGSGGGSVKKIM